MVEKRRHKREKVSMNLVISTLFRQNKINLINFDTPIEVIDVSKSGLGFKTCSILPIDYYFNAKLQFGEDESAVLYCIVKIIRASMPNVEEKEDENGLVDCDSKEPIVYGCEIVGMTSIHEEIFAKYEQIYNTEEKEL